jgi:hypothetical protein
MRISLSPDILPSAQHTQLTGIDIPIWSAGDG